MNLRYRSGKELSDFNKALLKLKNFKEQNKSRDILLILYIWININRLMIEIHHSISKTEKVFDSGGNPILVECEDLNLWVCKHARTSPRLLSNELLGSSFAQLWDLSTPEFCLLEISDDHLPLSNIIQPVFFKKHCFGSYFNSADQVIDLTIIPLLRSTSFRNKIANKSDYLKIGLFDIWLANEDRHPLHTNLLLSPRGKEYIFKVFDHDALFNQNNPGKYPLVLLDEECSLITGEISKLLFKRNKKLVNIVNEIVENFYLCVEKCLQNLENIVACIPDSWLIDRDEIYNALILSIFSDAWLKQCENYFRQLTQSYI